MSAVDMLGSRIFTFGPRSGATALGAAAVDPAMTICSTVVRTTQFERKRMCASLPQEFRRGAISQRLAPERRIASHTSDTRLHFQTIEFPERCQANAPFVNGDQTRSMVASTGVDL